MKRIIFIVALLSVCCLYKAGTDEVPGGDLKSRLIMDTGKAWEEYKGLSGTLQGRVKARLVRFYAGKIIAETFWEEEVKQSPSSVLTVKQTRQHQVEIQARHNDKLLSQKKMSSQRTVAHAANSKYGFELSRPMSDGDWVITKLDLKPKPRLPLIRSHMEELAGHFLFVTLWSGVHFIHEAANVPEQEFTLSAFGLPEPAGVAWPQPTPWYLWFLGIGLGSAAAAGYWIRRGQRGKEKRGRPGDKRGVHAIEN